MVINFVIDRTNLPCLQNAIIIVVHSDSLHVGREREREREICHGKNEPDMLYHPRVLKARLGTYIVHVCTCIMFVALPFCRD